jgi:hypothetical protein
VESLSLFLGRLVPVVYMVVNLRSQDVLADPPIVAGVSTSYLVVWQLRPTRDCGISPRRPPRGGCAKRALESGWNKLASFFPQSTWLLI